VPISTSADERGLESYNIKIERKTTGFDENDTSFEYFVNHGGIPTFGAFVKERQVPLSTKE
jgi:hypothetical protein